MMHHTGVPSGPDELPQFDPSPHWGERAVRAASPTFTAEAPEAYEEVLAGLARFVGDVDELFGTQRPGNRNLKGLASLYLGRSGVFYLLQPHTHDETARSVLREVHPELPPNKAERWLRAGGYKHTDLTLASGIQRVQIYPDGMGVTVELGHPPNCTQLDAVREAHARTPRARFVAEIDLVGNRLAHLTAYERLVELVNHWNPTGPEAMLRRWPWLARVLGATEAGV